MPVAVVSDIHANLEALETVLADIDRRGIESIFCLGDFVGYGASPNECIDLLRPRIEAAVIGNHDSAACGRVRLTSFNSDAAVAARWTESKLTPENRAYLEGLPFTASWHGMLAVHASPSQPEEWHYVLSPHEAEEEMHAYSEDLCLIGHSHYPGAFEWDSRRVRYTRDLEVRLEPGRRYLVNVGSVGQPRDGDPRAAYLVVGDGGLSVNHVRLDYDIVSAMQRITEAGLPPFLAERLRWGE